MTRRARIGAAVLTALLAGSGAALASCNFIVGVGDYTVGDAAEADGTNGGGNDAGSDRGIAMVDAIGGGLDVRVNRLDATPDRITAVGPCGQSLPIGQPDFQRLVDTCVLTISCDPHFFNVTISDCIGLDFLQSNGSTACLSTIRDCNGFYSCDGVRAATAAECPDGGVSALCANNVAVNCNSQIARNCTKFGGTCGQYIDSTGAAAVGCIVVPSCVDTDGGDQCLGNKDYVCISGVGYGLDCTTISATCANRGSGTTCYYDAPMCTTVGNVCNGDRLTACFSDNRSFTYNCARSGLSCSVDDAGVGTCVDRACATAVPCTEGCETDGHTLRACVGGAPYAIDCAQYPPYTSCTSTMHAFGSASPVPYAYCR
jgi:hypothetical protein